MSGKLEVPLAPGWSWELDLRPGGHISCPECQLNRPPGKPMGRGANQGQRNKGFDETGGPMGAQANQGQRSMVFDEPGSSIGRGEDSKFFYMDFRFIAVNSSRANEEFPRIQRHSDTARDVPALPLRQICSIWP